MRRGAILLVALAVLTLVAPGRSTLAAWTDPTPASASASLTTSSLQAPSFACNEVGTSSVISWTPSTTPTALTYSASLVNPPAPLTITNNSVTISPGLLDGLLGGLLGSSLTVRVTASLPGTSWTTSATRTVFYRLVLIVPTVQCS